MLTEIIGIITTGITIVEGVTRIIKNLQDINGNEANNSITSSISEIQQRLNSVESELNKPQPNQAAVIEAYSTLISALQQDTNYSPQLRIVPTDYGTWKILRKRKSTMFIDPHGEYSQNRAYRLVAE